MTTIRQIMSPEVFAVRPETTVEATIAFLTEHRLWGAPVTNEEGELVGIISELALIDVVFDGAVRNFPVSKYMTTDVYSVRPDDSLNRAAQLFALYDFRRLPVVEHGKLVGILSRRDLMNHALASGQQFSDPLVDLVPSLAPIS
jgi:CBS domain-containing protein